MESAVPLTLRHKKGQISEDEMMKKLTLIYIAGKSYLKEVENLGADGSRAGDH
jgi:hypothetical protein